MSGLYNILFGENQNQRDFLFKLLELTPHDCGRYRDIYVIENYIVVHTRNGGGNRDDYEAVFESLAQHPLYEYDEDDDFDSTYADIYFRWPTGYNELLAEMALGTVTPAEKWQLLFDNLNG